MSLRGGYYEDTGSGQDARSSTLLIPLNGRNGYLFSLCAVRKPYAAELRPLCAVIIEQIERLARSFGERANAQHRFEQFLSLINEQLALAAGSGAWDLPIEEFNAVIGIAIDDDMYLSGAGDLTAMFLHRLPPDRFQVFNLSRSIRTEQSLPSWDKAFGVVLEGYIGPGDVFCTSNQDFQPVIQNEELHAILSTLPPKSATAKIRQYFSHTDHVAVLILQNAQHASVKEDAAKPLSELSVNAMIRTEDETAKFLEDENPNVLAKLAAFARSVPAAARRLPPDRVRAQASRLASRLRGWFAFRTARIAAQAARADAAMAPRLGPLRRLPRRSRFLLAGAFACAILLATGLSVLTRGQEESYAAHAFETDRSRVTDLQEQAAAAVIYRDEDNARRLYLEALALALDLPSQTDEERQAADRLVAEISRALDEIRHVISIPEPPVAADFALAPENPSPRTLFLANGILYAITDDERVYRVDPGQPSPTDAVSSGIGAEFFFLDGRSGISRFDSAARLSPVAGLEPAAGVRWSDVYAYAGKLYVLEPAGVESEGQILRFERSGSGWSAPNRWIRSKSTDLTDAKSLAIDGTIFVLKKDGTIVRFANGSEIGWHQGVVDPPFSNPTDLWTDIDSDYLYVLEPSQRRLVIYRKDGGEFLAQYRSDRFDDLKGLAIDEKSGTAYLANGQEIFAISLDGLR